MAFFISISVNNPHISFAQFSTGFSISDQSVGTSWVSSRDAFLPVRVSHPDILPSLAVMTASPGPESSHPWALPQALLPLQDYSPHGPERRPATGSEVFPQPFRGLDIVQVKRANLRFPGKGQCSPTPPSLEASTYTSGRLATTQASGGFSFLLYLGTFSFFNRTHIFGE